MDKRTQAILGLAIGLSGGSTQEWADAVERSGQAELVNTERLPKDTGMDKSDFAPYEQMGIKFGAPIDDIFVEATLPPGWKKERTSHYMWSKVVDDKGRERISIFYKPEFYDRSAHMSLCRRYAVCPDYSQDGDSETVHVRDGEQVIHTLGTASGRNADSNAYYDEAGRLEKAATAWLDENYPDWRNPLAYWD